jgi:hypothetical protein
MVAEAVLTGSSRADLQSIESLRKAAGFRRLFSIFLSAAMTGEYPAGLLDIGGSLC